MSILSYLSDLSKMSVKSVGHTAGHTSSMEDGAAALPVAPETTEEDFLLDEVPKVVHFDPTVSESTMNNISTPKKTYQSEMEEKILARQKQEALVLLNRLYDKPSNCQALVQIRQREALLKKREGGKGTELQEETAKIPRPPSGKSRGPGIAFRTTMFKKDYERQKKKRIESDMNSGLPEHMWVFLLYMCDLLNRIYKYYFC